MRAVRHGFVRGEFGVVVIAWFLPPCIGGLNHVGLPLAPALIIALLTLLLTRRATIGVPSLAG